jgi:xanthine dehydrogenase accessory factor
VEGDILTLAAEVIAGAPHARRHYGVANAQAWEVGLPCGGDIAVLVQPVSDAGFASALFEAILNAQGAGETLLVGTDLENGLSRVVAGAGDAAFVNVYAPPKRLLIIGAVEIAVSLASIASQLGIAVTVIDPRAHFLTKARFPTVALDDRWPDVALTALAPDSRTAVVTLSHDPKIDDPALIEALASPAPYIGALGSRASHAARRLRLLEAGVNETSFARIEGPAGVSINSVNASEIALSIAAAVVRSFNDGLR